MGSVCVIDEEYESEDIEETAYCRALKRQFERYSSYMPKISNDVVVKVLSINETASFAIIFALIAFLSIPKSNLFFKLCL